MARQFYFAASCICFPSLIYHFSSDHLLYARSYGCLINLIGTTEGVYPRGVTNYILYTPKSQRAIICRPIIMFFYYSSLLLLLGKLSRLRKGNWVVVVNK